MIVSFELVLILQMLTTAVLLHKRWSIDTVIFINNNLVKLVSKDQNPLYSIL